MSSSTAESPIRKVIFLQKIFRFAGRTLTDLGIINFVCKDFEETMQVHHTFNLVLYDNIIKKRHQEEYFPYRSVKFLSTAPAWIVYQWTVVNEHDETQRELLKTFLLFQAENENQILIRDLALLDDEEDSTTTQQLLCHILDSCFKLGIAKEVLEVCSETRNCIMQAVSRKISADLLSLLIESCFRHGLDLKKMMEQQDSNGLSSIMLAAGSRCPDDSFTLLIESCIQHGVDLKNLLEQKDNVNSNCILLASENQLPFESFKLLVETCVKHGVDMKQMLEQLDDDRWSCISLATFSELPIDSFRLLIAHFPSNESFQSTLSVKTSLLKSAVEYARTEEMRALLEDRDCWHKCCEWRKMHEVS